LIPRKYREGYRLKACPRYIRTVRAPNGITPQRWPQSGRFQISRGAADKTIVEMKLAKNTQLKRNLERQIEIYKKASDAKTRH
jgi:hypothetical protein